MPAEVEVRDDRTIVFFRTDRLDHDSTRDLVPALEAEMLDGRKLGLELRPVGWVTPFGLVYLYWYVRWLLDQGVRRVDVVLDRTNPDVCNYLKRMKIDRVFADEDPVTFYPIQNMSIRERDLSGSLVELTAVRVDNTGAVEREAQRIVRVLTQKRPDLRAQRHELQFAVVELLDNVLVHSRSRRAALAVQAYQQKVSLALGDGGRGIPAALRGHVDAETDGDYVEQALEPQVTSRLGGGGMGLTMLAEEVRENGGHMALRSGSGHVVLRTGRREKHDDCGRLPGTLVEVGLRR